MHYVSWVWHNTPGIRLNMTIRVVTGLLQVALGLLMVWLCKEFIDVTIRTGTTREVWTMIVLLVLTVLGGILLRQVYFYLGVMAQIRQANGIRLRIFGRLMRRRLYEGRPLHSGELVSRLEKDIDTVSDTVASLLPELLVMGGRLLGAFALLHLMDTTLAWMLLLLTPLFLIVGKFVARRLRGMSHDIRNEEGHIQQTIQEGLEHNAVLRALESTDWLTGQVDHMQGQLTGLVHRRTRFNILARSILASCFGLGYLLAFVWGGLQLRDGVITLGVMTSFLQLVSQVQQPILGLLNMVPQIIHTTASIDRLEELERLETEENSKIEKLKNSRIQELKSSKNQSIYGIRFEGVSFKYAEGERFIMNGFTHDFRPGSRTAIVGETGAGKTTLFRLLLAMAKPQTGRIHLYQEGEADREVDVTTRSQMVFVPQGNTLMSGTIRYNLLLARPEADDDELRRVLHTAMADFVLSMPDGLDTQIGERGTGLSEGQAQRIAIARGLLRPGSILLLDEISSALDEQTERELFNRLFTACPDKTILLITHRASVARLCDESIDMSST